MMFCRWARLFLAVTLIATTAHGANKPQREQWFMDQALGMFVHWSVDSQLGSPISPSMVGALDEYPDRPGFLRRLALDDAERSTYNPVGNIGIESKDPGT